MELRLREILKSKSMTLKSFSEISGISQPNLSNYINGNISPTLEMLNRIASCLGVRVTELLHESGKPELLVRYKGVVYNVTDDDLINLIESKRSHGYK